MNWKKLLLYLYSAPDSPELLSTNSDFKHTVAYLEKHDLIERQKKGYVLTRKGFDVALEIEKHEENFRLQLAVVAFTGVLLFTAMFQFLQEAWPVNNWVLISLYFLVVLALLYRWKKQRDRTVY